MDKVIFCAKEPIYNPEYKTAGSAGGDLRAYGEYEIAPHTTVKIDTGLRIKLPKGYAYIIEPRSSTLPNKGLLVNFGLIDQDYLGPIKIVAHNLTNETIVVENGERIAQGVIIATPKPESEIMHPCNYDYFAEQFESERGEGGFGSTGDF